MFIVCDTTYLPFIAKAVGCQISPLGQCIMCVDEKTRAPIAGVAYDGYNGAIIHAHIWVDAERRPSPEWLAAIFDYPFNRLQVHKIVGQVNSGNMEARKLDEHFGFVLEATVKEFYDDGNDLLVYTMRRDQCRVLTSRRWASVMERISRI